MGDIKPYFKGKTGYDFVIPPAQEAYERGAGRMQEVDPYYPHGWFKGRSPEPWVSDLMREIMGNTSQKAQEENFLQQMIWGDLLADKKIKSGVNNPVVTSESLDVYKKKKIQENTTFRSSWEKLLKMYSEEK